MKNLFGVVPGSVYGWPKNVLHWQGIDNSIIELASTIPIHYVIADGIAAMKGNGPLHGYPVNLGYLVFADDPVAADFFCCDLLGIAAGSVRHLALGTGLANSTPPNCLHLGENTKSEDRQKTARLSLVCQNRAPAASLPE
jgi:uncharacterized protein (DUF362 family)